MVVLAEERTVSLSLGFCSGNDKRTTAYVHVHSCIMARVDRWHTINLDLNWRGPIGLVAWAQFWPQNWPQTNFWPGFESWPGLKFGLLNNAWPEHFFQTDIFSVNLIGFID